MKRRDFINLAGQSVLITPLIAGCSPKKTSGNSRHLVETPEKRAEYLAKMLKALCTDLGPHPIGSPEYDRAALIVKKELESALPIVELDTFNFERWVLLTEPELYVGQQRLETYPGHGSSGTPSGGITGILEKIEDAGGIPYGVVDKLTGEIRAYITLSRYGKAVPLPYYSFGKKVKCLPTFNVGLQDVPILETALANGTPVRLNVQVDFIPNTLSANVVGTLPGESEDEIVFLAHLDTVYSSPGANDNTATLVAMLMLAHAFSGTRPGKTLTFIATTGEEYDKLGAIDYVGKRKKAGTLKNIKLVVNLDSVTWGPDLQINTENEELISLISSIDRELSLNGTPAWKSQDGFMLDAGPFRESGARAVYVNSEGYNISHLWHRPEDIPENVPADCVEIFFQLFYEFTKRVQEL
ncbi:MAG TPA: M28 family peptidase [archaeon]|nr:M28 family peptidase [archaeon]